VGEPKVEWVIWYDDGSSFTNTEGRPHEAPRWGVLCVAGYSADHGRVIWHGGDYYFFEAGEWCRCDLVGLIDYLTRPGAEKIVLIGRAVPPAQFWAIYERANGDLRLPPRSSYSPLERST
jgi:hypothetical protein